jgi:hypothetical protein
MTEGQYWELIRDTNRRCKGDSDCQVKLLFNYLITLFPGDIVKFDRITRKFLDTAYRWDLWGAIFVKESGCSDDNFTAVRCWLLLQGKEMFFDAISDPDNVISKGVDYCDSLLSSIYNAYHQLTHDSLPTTHVRRSEPFGTKWEVEALEGMFPNAARSAREEL